MSTFLLTFYLLTGTTSTTPRDFPTTFHSLRQCNEQIAYMKKILENTQTRLVAQCFRNGTFLPPLPKKRPF